jgi:hypothetical protein
MMRKSDHPEVRKLALMRRADTEAGSAHNIGGVRKKPQRRKPSLPRMPWDDEPGEATCAGEG